MAKRANTVKTVQITISTTRAIQAYLEQLTRTELYGKNPAETANQLLGDAIKALIKDRTLKQHRQPHDNSDGT